MATKNENLTHSQILVISSVEPQNSELIKVCKTDEILEIADLIFTDNLLSTFVKENNPAIYQGASNLFLISYNDYSDDFMIKLNGAVPNIDREFIYKFLGRIKKCEHNISIEQYMIFVAYCYEILNDDIYKTKEEDFGKCIIFNTDIVELLSNLVTNKEGIKEVTTFITDIDVPLSIFVFEIVSSIPLLTEEILWYVFYNLADIEKFDEMLQHPHGKESIMKKLLINIMKLTDAGILNNENVTDCVDFSAAIFNCINRDKEQVKLSKSLVDSINSKTDSSCTAISCLKNLIVSNKLDEKSVVFKISIKINKILKRVFRRFNKEDKINELYNKIKELMSYILNYVDDTQKEALNTIFNDITEKVNTFKNDKKGCNNLIKELETIVKDLTAVKNEIDSQQGKTNNPTDEEIKKFYKELGVEEGKVTKKELKQAYKEWAMNNHPDKFQDEDEKKVANDKFVLIKEIYEKEITKL